VALMGVQHAGKGLSELVRRLRNPLQNPNLVLRKGWERATRNIVKPKLTRRLAHFLHPSLTVIHSWPFSFSSRQPPLIGRVFVSRRRPTSWRRAWRDCSTPPRRRWSVTASSSSRSSSS